MSVQRAASRRLIVWTAAAAVVIVACLLIWLIVWTGATFPAAVGTMAAVVAAIATAWAAYQSRVSAQASATSARDARLALALHDRAWPHVGFVRTTDDDSPWEWVVTVQEGSVADRMQLRWTVDGSAREATRESLRRDEVWTQQPYVEQTVTAAQVRDHVGGIELEWQDPAGRMRWRSVVVIASGQSFGTYMANDEAGKNRVQAHIPFVNNSDPQPVW